MNKKLYHTKRRQGNMREEKKNRERKKEKIEH